MALATERATELAQVVRRVHQAVATPADRRRLEALGWRALPGGMNNVVYALQDSESSGGSGSPLVFKCYRVDGRDRAGREWRALRVLAAHGGGLAPRPVAYDPDGACPVIVMALVPGEPLRGRPLTPDRLRALAELRRHLYNLTPESEAASRIALPPVVGSVAAIAARVRAAHPALRASADAPARELAGLVASWTAGPDPGLLAAPAPAVFSAGDGNLANYLWDGRRLRRLDFEYSGWSDRAVDLADLVEHDGSRATPDDAWGAVVEGFALSLPEQARFAAARRLWALFWAVLLCGRAGPNPPDQGRFAAQLTRAARLLARA
jgi:hypothetical protein